MLRFGCIIIGLGVGLTLGNMKETIILLLVALIVGVFLYTRIVIYLFLDFNKTIKGFINITMSVLIGILVGTIVGYIPGAIMIGIGTSFATIDMLNYKKYKFDIKRNSRIS